MPQPTKGDVHVNKPLTNILVAYAQDKSKFIADKVFPLVPVAKQSDRFFKYAKEDWLRDEAQKRAPGTESSGSGFEVDNTPNYFCDVYAHHKDVDDQTRSNADVPINMDRDATEFVAHKLLLRREKVWISNYFKTGVWGTDFTPGTLWDAGGSDPVEDIDAQIDVVLKATGYKPNKLVVSRDLHTILKNHPVILDRIKYTQTAVVTEQLLASLFGLSQYLVLDAVENTAAKGKTASMSFLGTKDALLVYAAPAPSILQPSAGYTFSWTGLLGGEALGMRMKQFRMEHLESDRIEGQAAYDLKLVGADLGVFINNAIS